MHKDEIDLPVVKPADWPANDREAKIENLSLAFDRYIKQPDYDTKEVLVSLACEHDLNQMSSRGEYRISEYEVMEINTLYTLALYHNITSVRVYVYQHIAYITRTHKIVAMIAKSAKGYPDIPEMIEPFLRMYAQLRIFYVAYRDYIYEKERSLPEHIIEVVTNILAGNVSQDFHKYIQVGLTNLLNDISYTLSTKRDYIFKINRDEFKRLCVLQSELISKTAQEPARRPLRGVLMTQISNFIIKSRHGYNNKYVYKYISSDTARKTIENSEVWLHPIHKLNDSREGCVLLEVLEQLGRCSYKWAQELSPVLRNSYVCSFSKAKDSGVMKGRYGSCVYGFKGDRMVDLLSPIAKWELLKKRVCQSKGPDRIVTHACEQVIPMDVIYDREEALSEMRYLCDIINVFQMTESEKKLFLEEILQYWTYSFKDAYGKDKCGEDCDWECEQERRYVLFVDKGALYHNALIEDEYLKVKSSLFLFPDFVLGENPVKDTLKWRADEKRHGLSRSGYYFCHDCLMRDYDLGEARGSSCPICGSSRMIKER